MSEEPERFKALICATAYKGDRPMRNHLRQDICASVMTSTDIPPEALGEAVGIALSKAWQTGIDPALEEGFHIRVTFR